MGTSMPPPRAARGAKRTVNAIPAMQRRINRVERELNMSHSLLSQGEPARHANRHHTWALGSSTGKWGGVTSSTDPAGLADYM